MIDALIKCLLAYALGNVMGGAIVGRLRGGVDLRQQGSGNIGATNALRTQGKAFAIAVLLIDVFKGAIAARLLPMLPAFPDSAMALPRETLAYLCGVSVAIGHCYPIVLGFKGGKGVATLGGVFAALLPAALPLMLLLFVLLILCTGYVSAATLAAAFGALLYVLLIDAQSLLGVASLFTIGMVALVLFKHRQNIQRLLDGSEHRFERARLIGRWIDRRRGIDETP